MSARRGQTMWTRFVERVAGRFHEHRELSRGQSAEIASAALLVIAGGALLALAWVVANAGALP